MHLTIAQRQTRKSVISLNFLNKAYCIYKAWHMWQYFLPDKLPCSHQLPALLFFSALIPAVYNILPSPNFIKKSPDWLTQPFTMQQYILLLILPFIQDSNYVTAAMDHFSRKHNHHFQIKQSIVCVFFLVRTVSWCVFT